MCHGVVNFVRSFGPSAGNSVCDKQSCRERKTDREEGVCFLRILCEQLAFPQTTDTSEVDQSKSVFHHRCQTPYLTYTPVSGSKIYGKKAILLVF